MLVEIISCEFNFTTLEGFSDGIDRCSLRKIHVLVLFETDEL